MVWPPSLVSEKLAAFDALTPDALVVTEYVPAVAFAVADTLAWPELSVWAQVLAGEVHAVDGDDVVRLAPLPGGPNVTSTPDTGLPPESPTDTTRLEPNAELVEA